MNFIKKGMPVLALLVILFIASGCELLMDTFFYKKSESSYSSSGKSYSSTIPVAYYPFDGNANDMSENGHDASLDFGIYTNDRFGYPNRAVMTGDGHAIEIPHQSALTPTDITISLWMKTTGTDPIYCMLSKQADLVSGYAVMINHGKAEFVMGTIIMGSNSLVSTTGVVSGNWTHIVCVKAGSTMKIYINGVLENSRTTSYSIESTQYLNFGTRYGGYTYKGFLDDIRIYNCELSAAEISELYHETLSGSSTSSSLSLSSTSSTSSTSSAMVAYLPFDGSVIDASGNGRNGSISGNAAYTGGVSNSGIQFNGSNDYVTLDLWAQDSRKWGQDEVAIEFWARPNTLGQGDAFLFDFYKGKSYQYGQLRLVQFSDSDLRIGNLVNDPYYYDILHNWDIATFHHFALSVTKSNINYYLDGAEVDTKSILAGVLNTSMPYELVIGGEWSYDPTHKWFGSIDELKVWNYAKTDF